MKLFCCFLLFCSLCIDGFAANESLKGKINFTDVGYFTDAEYLSYFPSASSYLNKAIKDQLDANGYRWVPTNPQEQKFDLSVRVLRFKFDNTFGTYTANLDVEYLLTGPDFLKRMNFTTGASATLGQYMSWPPRINFVMEKSSLDSVNNFLNSIEGMVFEKKAQSVVQPLIVIPPIPQAPVEIIKEGQVERLSLDASKKKCTELGFKPATEGHGKCVLQLSK